MTVYMYNPANDSEIIVYPQAFFSDVSDNIKEFYEIFHSQKRLKKFEFENSEDGEIENVLAFKSKSNQLCIIQDLQFDEFEEQNSFMITDDNIKMQIQDYLVLNIQKSNPTPKVSFPPPN